MNQVLGIDLGTTTFKGAVLDLDRRELRHVHRVPAPSPVPGLPPTRHELDPEDVLAAVRNLLRELLQAAPNATALRTCSQMHGLVFTDDRGNPRSNVVTWKDQRARESGSLERLRELVTADEQHDIGRELRVGIPITTLHHLRETSELPAGAFATSLPDFVLANLCKVEPVTEATNAAAQGLFHLGRGDWHRELIAKLGLDALRWPTVRPLGSVVGVADIAGRLLTCYTPVGDQQCALAGVELRAGELSLNVSTGSQVGLLGRDRPRGEFLLRPYFEGQFLRTLVSVPAGRSLTVLVDLLTELGRHAASPAPDPWEYVRHAVDAVPDTDLEVDLSFFASLTGDRGHIANIREGNFTIGHLFAAAFRTMARNYAHCAAVLSPGREWNRVAFSGGLPRQFPRLRNEILAALGNPPHRLAATEEETLTGLLVLAASELGQ